MLDDEHYGIEKVKNRIIEAIAVKKLAGEKNRAPIICLVGSPGVGKTYFSSTVYPSISIISILSSKGFCIFASVRGEVGAVNGLAWTSVGGVTMPIEVKLLPYGSGKIHLTGSLGDVMKESAEIAVSLIKNRSVELKISEESFNKYDSPDSLVYPSIIA